MRTTIDLHADLLANRESLAGERGVTVSTAVTALLRQQLGDEGEDGRLRFVAVSPRRPAAPSSPAGG